MNKLTKDEFIQLMKKAELNKKEFATILGTSYQSVNNWGTNGREYPYWVKSWLELYIENKQCKQLKQMIKDSGVCK
jgi:DNA-binding transcriptional regulator YiaG